MPKNARAGLPLHRPNLETFALTPGDLGTGNITYQGYQPDPALRPVSEYERDMTPAGSLASLQEVVLLFHSPTQAGDELNRLSGTLNSPQGWRRLGTLVNGVSALSDRASLLVHVGNGSRALIGTAHLPGGKRFSLGFICLRVGSTVEFVTFASSFSVLVPPATLVQLVDVVAAQAERGLHKSAESTTLPVA